MLQSDRLVAKHSQSEAVFIACLCVADLRLRLLQLRLAQFDDRAQSQLVARLGQVKRLIGLVQELSSDAHTFVSSVSIQPCSADVTRDPVAQICGLLQRGCARRSASRVWAVYRNPLKTGMAMFTPTAPYQFER